MRLFRVKKVEGGLSWSFVISADEAGAKAIYLRDECFHPDFEHAKIKVFVAEYDMRIAQQLPPSWSSEVRPFRCI